jgi:hypothetical protein
MTGGEGAIDLVNDWGEAFQRPTPTSTGGE